MKKSLLLASIMTAIMISPLGAVELRVGAGSYESDMKIKNFMSHDVENSILTLTLKQRHQALQESALFYYGDASYMTSSSRHSKTRFSNPVADYRFSPRGSLNDITNRMVEMFPVDGDYETLGFDMNVGLGYDVWKKGESYIGVALNTGMTLPLISAKNIKSRIDFAYDLMQRWELDVTTYKIGPALLGNVALDGGFSLFGMWSMGFQKGEVQSDLFHSGVDVKGGYSVFDVSARYQAKASPFFFSAGFEKKDWSVDRVEVNLRNFFKFDAFSPFEMTLSSQVFYGSVGYRF